MQEIVYIADPMCSWCWAIAPKVDQLSSETELPVRVVMGGLRSGPAAVEMTPRAVASWTTHWEKVATTSGQPFDPIGLRRDWLYDTHVASLAVVAMRELRPDVAAEFLSRVQRAFFSEGKDVTNRTVVASLVEPFDIDPLGFEILLGTPHIEQTTVDDYEWAKGIGATAFPTLMFATDTWARAIAIGYTTVEDMRGHIDAARVRVAEESS
jgi:putative protein-disulfide isomerase